MQSLTITENNVDFYAFTNKDIVQNTINAVVVLLHGWYESDMRKDYTKFEKELADNHTLSIYPYYSEWAWMNFPTIYLINDLIDFYIEKYKLPNDIPLIISGKSMGGLSALIYTLYAKKTPVACAVNCPICDLPFHITERIDIPRTIYAAYGHYNIPIEQAIKLHSPMHQVDNMPYIPYYIVHGAADRTVKKHLHSDPYVKKMKELNHMVEYHEVEGMKHCDFSTCPEEEQALQQFILSFTKPR